MNFIMRIFNINFQLPLINTKTKHFYQETQTVTSEMELALIQILKVATSLSMLWVNKLRVIKEDKWGL